jgi:hypothetical protein
MAINSSQKRNSVINFGSFIPYTLPIPDNNIDVEDRSLLLGIYYIIPIVAGIELDSYIVRSLQLESNIVNSIECNSFIIRTLELNSYIHN